MREGMKSERVKEFSKKRKNENRLLACLGSDGDGWPSLTKARRAYYGSNFYYSDD